MMNSSNVCLGKTQLQGINSLSPVSCRLAHVHVLVRQTAKTSPCQEPKHDQLTTDGVQVRPTQPVFVHETGCATSFEVR
jgi:hypothetical protein